MNGWSPGSLSGCSLTCVAACSNTPESISLLHGQDGNWETDVSSARGRWGLAGVSGSSGLCDWRFGAVDRDHLRAAGNGPAFGSDDPGVDAGADDHPVFWLPHARRAFTRARITSSIVTATMCENIRRHPSGSRHDPRTSQPGLYETKANDHFRTTVKAAAIAQLMLPTVDTLTGLALGIIALVGGNLVLQGELTAGVMIAYILYVQRFFDPIRALTLHYNAFLRAMASGERIFEVLDVPVGIQDKPDAKEIGRSDGSVRFEKVTFGYNPKYPVLHDINLEIPAGQTIALVGPTGCGKSSIASLIHRFYDTYEGRVLVGGHDTRSLTQQS